MGLATPDQISLVQGFRNDPVLHLSEVQGVSLEGYQQRVVRAIAEYDRVVITACHDVGKTFMLSRAILWFGSMFPQCKIITTAPTFKQVRMLLWSEIRTGFNNSKFRLGGTMLTTEWKIADDWFAVGMASRKEAGTETHGSSFQGFHAPYILIVLDEAQGIPADIYKQVEGMTTSANVKVVAIGNPLSKGSPYHALTKSRFWKHIKLNCFDSPNLEVNGITDLEMLHREVDACRALSDDKLLLRLKEYKIVRPHLLTASWVVQHCLELGVNHPLVLSKALGEFPDDAENSIISLAAVEEAQMREGELGENHIGVDVARFGSDKTVITTISGTQVQNPIKLVKKDNAEVAGQIMHLINKLGKVASVSVDATGVGSGVVDILRQNRDIEKMDIKIYEAHFGAGAEDDKDKKRFVNLKSLIFTDLALAIKKEIALPEDSAYQIQLPDIRYKLDGKGRVQIESKDDYKARTGRQSPDEADSLALAIYGRNKYNKKVDVTFNLDGLNLSSVSKWRT